MLHKKNISKLFNTIFGIKQKKFILNAIAVWFISQIVLHTLLIVLNIGIATVTSSLIYIFIGFKFYGENVFDMKKYSNFVFIKFFILTIFLWFGNFFGIHFFNSIFNNKNFSAILMVPILAIISFFVQKNFVFK
tara:strand:- start:1336 stop:1737 length:402 start_codon:yes stop_codon:yes gene_type:complete